MLCVKKRIEYISGYSSHQSAFLQSTSTDKQAVVNEGSKHHGHQPLTASYHVLMVSSFVDLTYLNQ